MERDVTVLSGGKKVPLNDFVRKLILNTLIGMTSALAEIDTDETLVIQIGKKIRNEGIIV